MNKQMWINVKLMFLSALLIVVLAIPIPLHARPCCSSCEVDPSDGDVTGYCTLACGSNTGTCYNNCLESVLNCWRTCTHCDGGGGCGPTTNCDPGMTCVDGVCRYI